MMLEMFRPLAPNFRSIGFWIRHILSANSPILDASHDASFELSRCICTYAHCPSDQQNKDQDDGDSNQNSTNQAQGVSPVKRIIARLNHFRKIRCDDPRQLFVLWPATGPATAVLIFRLQGTISSTDKRKKLVPSLFFSESTQHGGRYRRRVLFFDSAHHHAQVSRFNDYAYAQRFDSLVNRFRNLCRETLLYLQPPRKYIHQARNLTEPDDFPSWNIGDVDLAEKGQQMMFAQTEHLNVLDDYHLVISYIEHRAQQGFLRVLSVAFGQILQRTFHAFGSATQAIPLWIFAQMDQHFPCEILQAGIGRRLGFKYRMHRFSAIQFENPREKTWSSSRLRFLPARILGSGPKFVGKLFDDSVR